ncbi:MAG: AIR carboxylase family protein [Deltaproteobacteria bacterium]|nr:AIR carboxylase family protein [Deltaproteobacteria bacterium]
MTAFVKLSTPQLKLLHQGKVRDSYRVDDNHRLLVATDRLSCFDSVLPTPMPGKGAILTQMSECWFKKAQDIIPTHFVETISPNMTLVKEAKPFAIEMIVRGFLSGSMWKRYEKGERVFWDLKLPDGMQKDQELPQALVTPTTKEKIDRPITKAAIIEEGWATSAEYEQMEQVSLKLFQMGKETCKAKGVVLVDTKYEFGVTDKGLTLIDEIHTPDSSRFWLADNKEPMDKEFIRQWLLEHKPEGHVVPDEVIEEGLKRYENVFARLFEQCHPHSTIPSGVRAYHDLTNRDFIKKGLIVIVMGSKSDLPHAQAIAKHFPSKDIAVHFRIVSAHKNGERIMEFASFYNHTLEPTCVIAIAGRSNGLGGALAANLTVPVISCPPFKDGADISINIYSSLMMPSKAPALTAIYPEQAALAAMRALNLQSLREVLNQDIVSMKADLKSSDDELVGQNL